MLKVQSNDNSVVSSSPMYMKSQEVIMWLSYILAHTFYIKDIYTHAQWLDVQQNCSKKKKIFWSKILNNVKITIKKKKARGYNQETDGVSVLGGEHGVSERARDTILLVLCHFLTHHFVPYQLLFLRYK